MTRSDALRRCGWIAIAALSGAALMAPSTALATKPAPDHKVTICHATSSHSNPYVMPTVDIASSGHLRGGHDTRHEGPIWSPTLAKHVKWGDIIPPYTYGTFSYAGQNWTAEGRAIHAAGCFVLVATASPTASPTTTPTATPTGTTPPTGEPRTGPTPSGSVEAETGTPASTPAGSVAGATGTPAATPPETDAGATTSSPSDGGWRWLLVSMAGLLAMVLLAARPVARRR